MAKSKTTITVGEVEAVALVFSDKGKGRWVARAEPMDTIEFMDRYASDYKDGLNWKQATPVNMADAFGRSHRFYAVAVDDCFDPPVAIVRASHEGEAIDIFVDELDWAHIDDEALEDYRVHLDPAVLATIPESERWAHESFSDAVSFNSSGQAYDSEGIVVWEVKLVRIECE